MQDKTKFVDRIFQSEELPTLPTVATKLISLTAREDTTLSDISELISKDISLSAKVLKVANSAFYSFPQQIGSINQAVSILGINAVRSLVLSFSFLTMRGKQRRTSFDFKLFWEKSLAMAVAARLIMEQVEGADSEQVFLSGLLQNIGQLVLAKTLPVEYDLVIGLVADQNMDLLAVEENVFGFNHTFVGKEIAERWGFPEPLVAPIEFHHSPEQYMGKDSSTRKNITAVFLSDLLVHILYSDQPETYHKQFRKQAQKLLELTPQNLETILTELHIGVEQAGDYFDLKIKSTKSVQEILQEANIRLSIINLDYDQMNKQLIQTKMELEKITRELEEKNRRLDSLANIDGLTEVFNHRYFQSALDKEINRATRHNTTISLILIDIDHFKNFNDSHGHQMGDFVLKEFAQCILGYIREYDILARYGGEEFVVILPDTESEPAEIVAEKLREIVENFPFSSKDEVYRITASFGISSGKPATDDGFSKDNLIYQADQALYRAKEHGRNRAVSYTPKKKWFTF